MPIVPLSNANKEVFTLVTHPKKTYVSSSREGVTGSLAVFARSSKIEKESEPIPNFSWNPFSELADEDARIEKLGTALGQPVKGNLADGGIPVPYTEDAGSTIEQDLVPIKLAIQDPNINAAVLIENMMDKINSLSPSPRRQKRMDVIRFTPSFRVSKNTLSKNTIKEILIPYYRRFHSNMHWTYTNYHCLNFFTGSNIPPDSALIYKAGGTKANPESAGGVSKHAYCPSNAFTFDFHINPKYTTDSPTSHFHAGTILHMSSCYAVSLVTGSGVDDNGYPNAYRIMLQLSHSADIPPSKIPLTASNNVGVVDGTLVGSPYLKDDFYQETMTSPGQGDFIFLSSDNSLKRNHWHHVVIRWAPNANNSIGSFFIDAREDSHFHIPSSSVMNPTPTTTAPLSARSGSNALFVGNYFEGSNTYGSNSTIERFFNYTTSIKRGVDPFRGYNAENNVNQESDPTGFSLRHPLNAEVHNIKIYEKHRNIAQIVTSSVQGPADIEEGLIFYLPPYFVKQSPGREILHTPFQSISSSFNASTDSPFNNAMAFGVGGHLINLENFVREFVSGSYPLLFNLTGSEIVTQTNTARSANDFLYAPPNDDYVGVRKRNLTILPCDDGTFFPDFAFLKSGSHAQEAKVYKLPQAVKLAFGPNALNPIKSPFAGKEKPAKPSVVPFMPKNSDPLSKFVNDLGVLDLSMISLHRMVKGAFIPNNSKKESKSVITEVTSSFVGKINPQTGEIVPNSDPSGYWIGETQLDAAGKPEPKVFIKGGEITEEFYTGTPEDPSLGGPGTIFGDSKLNHTGSLAIFNRTRDGSSSQVTMFDMSNMFYGDRIVPGSYVLSDASLSGSSGKISIKLRDNANGGLYRADALTPHAEWNNVGNIFYYDGLAVIKSPHLYFFGKEQFETSFTGQHHKYVYTVHVPCPKGLFNSSSNPSFKSLAPSDHISDTQTDFVYITSVNLHDENMNVVARANLAQPVMKRNTDHFLFKIKIDY